MSRKIIYLINPISGTRGKSSLHELISRRTSARNIDFNILPTNAEGNYEYLLQLIEKEKVTDIVVCGGDGTVSAVASALIGTPTRIGIIPTGSGNGLAFAARIPASASKALDIIFSRRELPLSTASRSTAISPAYALRHQFRRRGRCMNSLAAENKGSCKPISVFPSCRFFRTGTYRFRIDLPPATAASSSPDPASDTDPTPPGISFPVDAFFISVANGNQFGNNFTIAPKARLDDGLLDIVIVKKAAKFRMVLSVIRQVMGRNRLVPIPSQAGNASILYFQIPALTIGNPDEAPLHIDGDPGPTAKELVIRIIPRAFTLIQPLTKLCEQLFTNASK